MKPPDDTSNRVGPANGKPGARRARPDEARHRDGLLLPRAGDRAGADLLTYLRSQKPERSSHSDNRSASPNTSTDASAGVRRP